MKQYIAFTAKIQFTTAVHIGSGKGGETTDAPLRRDAQGRIVLPGTAIAGALRTTATRLAPRMNLDSQNPFCAAIDKGKTELKPCACPVCHLFGDLHPGTEENTEKVKTHASHLWIYDAPLAEEQAAAFVRDGVGIDRQSGASASAGAAKFDLEVLPAGTNFDLRMELREPFEQDMMLLAATLAEWQAGRGRLGGRTARGLGAFILNGLQCSAIDLQDDLIKFLKSKKPWQAVAADAKWLETNLANAETQPIPLDEIKFKDKQSVIDAVAQSWVTVTFDLQFQGPFLIHDATLAGLIGYDHAPLLEKLPPANRDDKWRARPVLSGAGLRGVLRSHAERIARTLATHYAWDKDNRKEYFLDHCPACNPLQSKDDKDKKDDKDYPLTNCDTLLKRKKDTATSKVILSTHEEATDKHLCLACWLFGSTRRGSRLSIQDAGMIWENEEKRLPYKPQDFLAIDRFTGGGLEGAKFDALGLYAPRFLVTMHLENPADWELGWLTLVLRDLRDELVTFGFGAAKGYGVAKAEKFNVQLGFITADDIPLVRKKDETEQALQARKKALAATAQKEGQSLYDVVPFGESSFAANKAILEDWVDAFNKEVKDFQRNPEKLPSPVSDTYFKDDLPKLYPFDALASIVAA